MEKKARVIDIEKELGVKYSILEDDRGLLCPISQELFKEPVHLDGYDFEKSAIIAWLEKSQTHPMTRERVGPDTIQRLRTNFTTKSNCETYREKIRRKCHQKLTTFLELLDEGKRKKEGKLSENSTDLILQLMKRSLEVCPNDPKSNLLNHRVYKVLLLRSFPSDLQNRDESFKEIRRSIKESLKKENKIEELLEFMKISPNFHSSIEQLEEYLILQKENRQDYDRNTLMTMINLLYIYYNEQNSDKSMDKSKLGHWLLERMGKNDHTMHTLNLMKLLHIFDEEHHTFLCEKYFDENKYENCYDELVFQVNIVYFVDGVWKKIIKEGYSFMDSVMMNKITNFRQKFQSLVSRGSCELNSDQCQIFLQLCDREFELYERNGMVSEAIKSLQNLGEFYLRMGKFEHFQTFRKKLTNFFEEKGMFSKALDIYLEYLDDTLGDKFTREEILDLNRLSELQAKQIGNQMVEELKEEKKKEELEKEERQEERFRILEARLESLSLSHEKTMEKMNKSLEEEEKKRKGCEKRIRELEDEVESLKNNNKPEDDKFRRRDRITNSDGINTNGYWKKRYDRRPKYSRYERREKTIGSGGNSGGYQRYIRYGDRACRGRGEHKVLTFEDI